MTDSSDVSGAKRWRTGFYGIVSILVFVIAIGRFSTTNFMPIASGHFQHSNPYIHIHAVIATLWLLTYITHTRLRALR